MKLLINIKKQFFDEICSGKKTEEYRIIKPYWINKLVGKNYLSIIFQNGHSKSANRIETEYNGYEMRKIQHDYFGKKPVNVFVIKIGKIL